MQTKRGSNNQERMALWNVQFFGAGALNAALSQRAQTGSDRLLEELDYSLRRPCKGVKYGVLGLIIATPVNCSSNF